MDQRYERSLRIAHVACAREFCMTAVVRSTSMVSVSSEVRRDANSKSLSLKEALEIEHWNDKNATLWRVGDICTVLDVSQDKAWQCVLVSRHCRNEEHSAPTVLVCIKSSEFDLNESVKQASLQAVVDLSLPKRPEHQERKAEDSSRRHVPAFDHLQDGRKYEVYRCLLYCDGLNQYEHRKGSAGGCYLLPLNFQYKFRTSREAVRVLSLTPPGVSTSEALFQIFPDMVESITKRFPCTGPDRDETQVFLDVIGYVSDYPEISDKIDVLGHNVNFPCHLCSFKRFSGSSSEGSAYCMRSDVHSGDSAFLRCASRTKVLRNGTYSSRALNRIGLVSTTGTCSEMSRLFVLTEKLKETAAETPPPITDDGSPVVDALLIHIAHVSYRQTTCFRESLKR